MKQQSFLALVPDKEINSKYTWMKKKPSEINPNKVSFDRAVPEIAMPPSISTYTSFTWVVGNCQKYLFSRCIFFFYVGDKG